MPFGAATAGFSSSSRMRAKIDLGPDDGLAAET
jgi:hypothetical protein